MRDTVGGEPDAIAARSTRLRMIAGLGIDCWRPRPGFDQLFYKRLVTIVTDSHRQGCAPAARVAHAVRDLTDAPVVDLAPEQEDGKNLPGVAPTSPRIDAAGNPLAAAQHRFALIEKQTVQEPQ